MENAAVFTNLRCGEIPHGRVVGLSYSWSPSRQPSGCPLLVRLESFPVLLEVTRDQQIAQLGSSLMRITQYGS